MSLRVPEGNTLVFRREFKACPFCGREIRFEAVKCRYCGQFLEPEAPRPGKVCWFCRIFAGVLVVVLLAGVVALIVRAGF